MLLCRQGFALGQCLLHFQSVNPGCTLQSLSRQGQPTSFKPQLMCTADAATMHTLPPHRLLPSAAPSLWLSSDTRASSTYFCSRSARASASASPARACAASSCSRRRASSASRSLQQANCHPKSMTAGTISVGLNGQSVAAAQPANSLQQSAPAHHPMRRLLPHLAAVSRTSATSRARASAAAASLDLSSAWCSSRCRS